jgi:hypothetical protein
MKTWPASAEYVPPAALQHMRGIPLPTSLSPWSQVLCRSFSRCVCLDVGLSQELPSICVHSPLTASLSFAHLTP